MLGFAARSLVLSFFAGIVTWVFISLWTGPLLVWAAFIAWACFYNGQDNSRPLLSNALGIAIGALFGWAALLIIQAIPWPAMPDTPSWWMLVIWQYTKDPFVMDVNLTSLWAGSAVLVTALGMTLLSRVRALNIVPAGVYGYACVFAAGFAEPSPKAWKALMSPGLENALVAVTASMIIGLLIGLAHLKVSEYIRSRGA